VSSREGRDGLRSGGIALFVLVAMLLCGVRGGASGRWTIGAVDNCDGGELRRGAAAASDVGVWHVAYILGDGLWHAYLDGGTWQRTEVDSSIPASACAIAVDSEACPHISYYDYTTDDLKYAWYDGTNWHVTTVDSAGDVGSYNSIAVDGADHPHISYYDDTNDDLKYAWYDGTNWHLSTVDSVGRVGSHNSITVDGANHPHISYYDDTNDDLKYAWYDGTNWRLTTVDSVGNVGSYNSIAVDGADHPHISYYDDTNADLKYAWYDGTNWHLTTVDSVGNVGSYNSIAVDGADHPHISYYDDTNDNLKYAWYDGASWHMEAVDAGVGCALTLDGSERPVIIYRYVNVYGVACLRYAYSPASNLAPTAVGGSGQRVIDWDRSGQETARLDGSPSFDPDGQVASYTWRIGGSVISTEASPLLTLSVGTWTFTLTVVDNEGASGSDTVVVQVVGASDWVIETADDLRFCYGDCSVACRDAGAPFLFYHLWLHDDSVTQLTYKADGSWQFATAENLPAVQPERRSLALDSLGRPHVAFQSDRSLAFGSYDGERWSLDVVASCDYSGISLAIDRADAPHIAYKDLSSYGVRYASHSGGAWTVEVVDSGWTAGYYGLAIVADDSGRPCIAYASSNYSTWAALDYARRDGTTWHRARVDWPAVGEDPSLAVGPDGALHVAYYDMGLRDLKYAVLRDGVWHVETVDAYGDVGRSSAIGVDALGHVHVCYYDGTNDDLKYAYNAGAGWCVQTVDREGGSGCSMALDQEGRPHIGYRSAEAVRYAYLPPSNLPPVSHAGPNQEVVDWDNSGSESVKLDGTGSQDPDGAVVSYSWRLGGAEISTAASPTVTLGVGTHTFTLQVTDNDGATAQDIVTVDVAAKNPWTYETVESGTNAGLYTSLALDSAGRPHISHCSGAGLIHSWHDGAAWRSEVVDSSATGYWSSIAVDNLGRARISYCASGPLKYARYDGAAWQIEVVDSNNCEHSSLALDALNQPRISYYSGGSIKYASYLSGAGIWTSVVVGTGSGRTSLKLDHLGNAHVVYRWSSEELRHSWQEGSEWHTRRVDVVGALGAYASLALDSANQPRVSYYDSTNRDLKYAWHDGANWHPTTVDSVDDVGSYNSIAVDAADRPHISYYDDTNDDLKYAWYDGTNWHTETVDRAGSVGLYTALALGPGNAVDIAYRGTLKYASTQPAAQGTAAVFRVEGSTGNVLADGAFYGTAFNSGSADLAEWVSLSRAAATGTVLELDPAHPGSYRPSQSSCSSLVAGVVSSQPGMVLGGTASAEGKTLLALAGIVPVKVTNEGGPIQPGDLLVSSSTPGYAMRWAGLDPCPCALVGKALEPMIEETGVISVLLTAH